MKRKLFYQTAQSSIHIRKVSIRQGRFTCQNILIFNLPGSEWSVLLVAYITDGTFRPQWDWKPTSTDSSCCQRFTIKTNKITTSTAKMTQDCYFWANYLPFGNGNWIFCYRDFEYEIFYSYLQWKDRAGLYTPWCSSQISPNLKVA